MVEGTCITKQKFATYKNYVIQMVTTIYGEKNQNGSSLYISLQYASNQPSLQYVNVCI